MPETSTTEFVPSSDEYKAPERAFDRMRAITAKLQPVDGQGHDRPRKTVDPTVTAVVPPPAAPIPSMGLALAAAAQAVGGVDLAILLDSQSFCAELGRLSPADGAGLEAVIREFQPAPTAPGMAVNRSQGHVGASVAAAPKDLLERLQMETAKHADQPLPPGSTTL